MTLSIQTRFRERIFPAILVSIQAVEDDCNLAVGSVGFSQLIGVVLERFPFGFIRSCVDAFSLFNTSVEYGIILHLVVEAEEGMESFFLVLAEDGLEMLGQAGCFDFIQASNQCQVISPGN